MPSTRDTTLLVAARITRLFAYGFLSVILALYLTEIGFSEAATGVLLTLTLAGDAGVSLWLTTTADRFGRRRTLVVGGALMAAGGAVFALTTDWTLLAVAATLGVISPTGKEIGPFLSIEQAALTEVVAPARRTHAFAWYHFAGSLAAAAGALAGGVIAEELRGIGFSPVEAYRVLLIAYAVAGVVLVALFLGVSSAVEATPAERAAGARPSFGLHRSRSIVMRLSALFALDAFAGAFLVQSVLAYWFHVRFGIAEGAIGAILFGGNLLAGLSALVAARLAARLGLVKTMVVTHLPSNVLLCLVPLMPTLGLAVAVLLVRFSISQMDVPTRQSYTMAVVAPDERSAAAGITTIARSVGAAMAPALGGVVMATSLAAPFFVSGGLKIVYDLLLYRSFRALRPPEERPPSRMEAGPSGPADQAGLKPALHPARRLFGSILVMDPFAVSVFRTSNHALLPLATMALDGERIAYMVRQPREIGPAAVFRSDMPFIDTGIAVEVFVGAEDAAKARELLADLGPGAVSAASPGSRRVARRARHRHRHDGGPGHGGAGPVPRRSVGGRGRGRGTLLHRRRDDRDARARGRRARAARDVAPGARLAGRRRDSRRSSGSSSMTKNTDETFEVRKTDEDWQATLSPKQYDVLRRHGTEMRNSSPLNAEKRPGMFLCAGCGQELFGSETKFDSGTGWPSFWAPKEDAVGLKADRTHLMTRVEVHCSRCGGHLGHVFEDGPQPTGFRYCMNGAAMKFEAKPETDK